MKTHERGPDHINLFLRSLIPRIGKKMSGISIEDVKMKYEEQLMCLPNVIGVGIGEKAGKPVIKVFVAQKVLESALHPHEIVPKSLDGYETDVEGIGVVMAQTQ